MIMTMVTIMNIIRMRIPIMITAKVIMITKNNRYISAKFP